MNHPECTDCNRPAVAYEKDSSPRRWYCGRHAAKWARKGVPIIHAQHLAHALKTQKGATS